MRAFWRRKPTLTEGLTRWIVCCNPDGSNLCAEVINNPAEVPKETVYDTIQGAWEKALEVAVEDRYTVFLAYQKSHREVERIENTLKSLTTGDTA